MGKPVVEFEIHINHNVNISFYLNCFQTPQFLFSHEATVSKLWNTKPVDLTIVLKLRGFYCNDVNLKK